MSYLLSLINSSKEHLAIDFLFLNGQSFPDSTVSNFIIEISPVFATSIQNSSDSFNFKIDLLKN